MYYYKLGHMFIFIRFKIVTALVGVLSNKPNLNTDAFKIRPEAPIRLILLSHLQRKQTGRLFCYFS